MQAAALQSTARGHCRQKARSSSERRALPLPLPPLHSLHTLHTPQPRCTAPTVAHYHRDRRRRALICHLAARGTDPSSSAGTGDGGGDGGSSGSGGSGGVGGSGDGTPSSPSPRHPSWLKAWIWLTAGVYLVWRWQWRRRRRLAAEAERAEQALAAAQDAEWQAFAARYRRPVAGSGSSSGGGGGGAVVAAAARGGHHRS
jgi:uncharacterized membrane protein YgcG